VDEPPDTALDDVSLDAAQTVQVEEAVEMIDLVLQRTRQQSLALDRPHAPIAIRGAHDDA
jgi:hypothetical protein